MHFIKLQAAKTRWLPHGSQVLGKEIHRGGTLSVKEIYVARLGAVGHIDAGCQKLFLEHRFLIGIRRGDDDANLNV